MRYNVTFVCIFLIFVTVSCKKKQDKSPDLNALTEIYELNDITYSVPSPHQISLLIKDDCSFYSENLFTKKIDVHLYSTSEKKALVLGALSADLGYLSLYDQKDLALQYIDKIKYLIDASKFGQNIPIEMFNRMENNFDTNDSILNILADLHRKQCETIYNAETPYLGSLIIAGGWIESFFILNKLYDNTKNSNLFGLLLQQQYAVENIIKLLRPYYRKSKEYTDLIDKLVEIAYEYEVIDVNYKNYPPHNSDSTTYIRCRFTPTLSGSQLEHIFNLSQLLRNSIIN